MRQLRELYLPKLVEARRNGSGNLEIDAGLPYPGSPLHLSQSSTASDQTPISPTFSLRCHSRLPSSSSSVASSPAMRASLDGFKRPLTEVKEEPHHERDSDFEMVDAFTRDSPHCAKPAQLGDVSAKDYLEQDTLTSADYDWVDSPSFEIDDFEFAMTKRRCAEEITANAIQSRLSSRLPSLTRKWKSRKDTRSSSIADGTESTRTRSRASSLRSPSLFEGKTDPFDRRETPIPPTPSQSGIIEHIEDPSSSTIDVSKDVDLQEEDELCEDDDLPENLARTPLLPPVMAIKTANEQVQSPLQSPKIEDTPSMPQSPFESPSAHYGLPSPPLSTKPSVASFHHRPIAPSSEIPVIRLADPRDEWAVKLGHANFTITPEPYQPSPPTTLVACQQLWIDWRLAYRKYKQHLAKTGDVYNTTSKIYQMTEEKWASIDAIWKQYHEQALAAMVQDPSEALQSSLLSLSQEPVSPTKGPAIDGTQSEGKFPTIGHKGIVGPMEQAKPPSPPRSPTKKRGFWKFLQGVIPSSVAFGRPQA